MSLADYWQRIKGHESEIRLILIVVLTAGLSLGLWRLWSSHSDSAPIIIENVPVVAETSTTQAGESVAPAKPQALTTGQFVASKNGTRYYLPTCAGAKRIKEENKIWFATEADARARGLTLAANCP